MNAGLGIIATSWRYMLEAPTRLARSPSPDCVGKRDLVPKSPSVERKRRVRLRLGVSPEQDKRDGKVDPRHGAGVQRVPFILLRTTLASARNAED